MQTTDDPSALFDSSPEFSSKPHAERQRKRPKQPTAFAAFRTFLQKPCVFRGETVWCVAVLLGLVGFGLGSVLLPFLDTALYGSALERAIAFGEAPNPLGVALLSRLALFGLCMAIGFGLCAFVVKADRGSAAE